MNSMATVKTISARILRSKQFCLHAVLCPLLALPFVVFAQETPEQRLVPIDGAIRQQFELLSNDSRVVDALANIEVREPDTIREQFRMTEIPAPPFQEARRANHYLEQLQLRGLSDAYIDSEGNAVAIRRGTGDGPTLLVAAHLDTVFPEGVDTTVELRGGRYYAPGIGDDTRGLTALLSVIDALNETGIQTRGDIIFSGNVGEEGRGDFTRADWERSFFLQR